jgi:Ca-activated chloride channel family protein
VDIVVAFDMSGSMMSEDFEVPGGRMSRFDMARSVLEGFVQKRPNDRLGLIVFATQAYIATPLTLDHDFFLQNLDRLQIGNIDPNSTAIGSAMGTALNRLRDLKSKSRILILMTDGENNAGQISPLMAAEAARALGVKVYTIGIGMQGSAPMPVFVGGQKVGYQQVPVDVDIETLQKIADVTGGKYYRADNTENFRKIYADIDKLEKNEATIRKYSHYTELFPWAVTAGLLLLLAEIGLANTIWRKIP